MDNNNDGNSGQQRSTLPRSLIPHLYSAPQTSRDSSTRTTLPEPEEEDPDFQQQQRSFSPFALRPLSSEHPSQSPPLASRRYPTYDHPVQPSSEPPEMRLPHTVPPIPNDPPFYISRPAPIYSYPQMEIQQPFASSWRVGEAGPSSGVVHRSHSYPQRGYHYMDIQYTQHQQHQPQHRQSYSSQGGHYSDYNAYTQGHTLTSDSLLSPHQAHRQIPEHMYSGDPSRAVTQDLYTLPPHSQLSGSSSQSSIARGWYPTSTASSSNTIANRASSSYSSLPLHQSAEYLTEPDDDDGEYLPPGRRNQKRKLESSEQEFGSRPKKTLIACDFCRGRKLRCDGTRPSCSNCKSRDNQPCVYQSYPRRRGPGKAPKGQRKKKAATPSNRDETNPAFERSMANGESQHYSTSGDDFEMDRLAPDFRSQQQHLPPLSILPYPGPPQGGMILPSSSRISSGETPFPPQNQEQGRFQRYIRRGSRDSIVSPPAQPPYPDEARR